MVSDPYLNIMLDGPKSDTKEAGSLIHQLICGKPPCKVPLMPVQISREVKYSPYFHLV